MQNAGDRGQKQVSSEQERSVCRRERQPSGRYFMYSRRPFDADQRSIVPRLAIGGWAAPGRFHPPLPLFPCSNQRFDLAWASTKHNTKHCSHLSEKKLFCLCLRQAAVESFEMPIQCCWTRRRQSNGALALAATHHAVARCATCQAGRRICMTITSRGAIR
jgi:hypothetical protein